MPSVTVTSEMILIKTDERKSFAEVLREIRNNVKPEDVEVEVKSMRRTRTGGILVELGLITDKEILNFNKMLKKIFLFCMTDISWTSCLQL